jgi:hypothetical protein
LNEWKNHEIDSFWFAALDIMKAWLSKTNIQDQLEDSLRICAFRTTSTSAVLSATSSSTPKLQSSFSKAFLSSSKSYKPNADLNQEMSISEALHLLADLFNVALLPHDRNKKIISSSHPSVSKPTYQLGRMHLFWDRGLVFVETNKEWIPTKLSVIEATLCNYKK